MTAFAKKIKEGKNQLFGESHPKKNKEESKLKLIDNRHGSIQAMQLQNIADSYSLRQSIPIQKKENSTGLPENLKLGIENLSGFAMDDVTVHYNSNKPAQLSAFAYAQGTQIHLGPGQEKHLPHEAWHVVQQKQGRVKPTMQIKGNVNVNDDASLETEADIMGDKALQMKVTDFSSDHTVIQAKSPKEWWEDRKKQYRAWRARRRAQQSPLPHNDSGDLSADTTNDHLMVEVDSSSEYDAEEKNYPEEFMKEDIKKYTKKLKTEKNLDYLRELDLPIEDLTRVETFSKDVTGDEYGAPPSEQLNFENLYGKQTWVMENNFRDKSRAKQNFFAADVVDVQAEEAGFDQNYIPDYILRKNVIEKGAIKFLEGNPQLLNKEFSSNSEEFVTLYQKIKNIKSTSRIVERRDAEIESLRIIPRQGDMYMIVIKIKRKE